MAAVRLITTRKVEVRAAWRAKPRGLKSVRTKPKSQGRKAILRKNLRASRGGRRATNKANLHGFFTFVAGLAASWDVGKMLDGVGRGAREEWASPDPVVRPTGGLQVTRQRSGTGRPAVAEDGRVRRPWPNQHLLDHVTETRTGTEDQEQEGDEAEQETDGTAFGRGGEGCEPGRVAGLARLGERLRCSDHG